MEILTQLVGILAMLMELMGEGQGGGLGTGSFGS